MKVTTKLVAILFLWTEVAALSVPSTKSQFETPEQKLKNYILRDFEQTGRVEVQRVFIKESIPAEAEVMAVEPRPALGLVNFEFSWLEGGVSRHSYGTATVKWYKSIAIAKTVIRDHEPFTSENCSMVEREVSPYRVTGYYDNFSSLSKLQARGYINPGLVISHNHTQAPFLVTSGESVELVRETPNIRVSIRAKALENGREQQWIRVENFNTKKVIQAKVVKSGQVSLH